MAPGRDSLPFPAGRAAARPTFADKPPADADFIVFPDASARNGLAVRAVNPIAPWRRNW